MITKIRLEVDNPLVYLFLDSKYQMWMSLHLKAVTTKGDHFFTEPFIKYLIRKADNETEI